MNAKELAEAIWKEWSSSEGSGLTLTEVIERHAQPVFEQVGNLSAELWFERTMNQATLTTLAKASEMYPGTVTSAVCEGVRIGMDKMRTEHGGRP